MTDNLELGNYAENDFARLGEPCEVASDHPHPFRGGDSDVAKSNNAPANRLLFGDNLEWLSKMEGETVDLIYLDPPFNSKATYNLLYRSPDGEAAQAQYKAFVDSWRWDTGSIPTAITAIRNRKSESMECSLLSVVFSSMEKQRPDK